MRIVLIVVGALVVLGAVVFGATFLLSSSDEIKQEISEVNEQEIEQNKTEDDGISLRETRERIRAKTEIRSAVNSYSRFRKDAPRQAGSTLKILINLMKKGRLPSVFLSVPTETARVIRKYERLSFDPKNIIDASFADDSVVRINCTDVKNPKFDYAHILVGDILDNEFSCTIAPRNATEDQIFLGGPGDDTIVDVAGNKIINGGTGDDRVQGGLGRKILVFEKGWGKDIVKGSCTNAVIEKSSLSQADPMNRYWTHKFANFVIFGPQVYESDMEWQGLTYVNKVTGDSIAFENKCYNFIFYDK